MSAPTPLDRSRHRARARHRGPLARWRRRLPDPGLALRRRRRPSPRIVVAVVAAFVAASLTHHALVRAEQARAAWGTTQSVWVVDRALDPGQSLSAAHLTRLDWPAALVPDGAVVESPAGRVVRGPLGPGHAVTEWVLGDASGPLALLPTGWRGVTVDTGDAPPPVMVGDVVEVLSTVGPATRSVLATDAIVIDVDREHRTATIAVVAQDAATVASAGRAGMAVLVLVA